MVGKVNANTTRHLLVCFLWVLRHAEDVPLKNWWSELNPQKLHRLLELLFICVSCFEYQGKRRMHRSSTQRGGRPTDVKTRLEDLILGQGSARSELIQRRRGMDLHDPNYYCCSSRTLSIRIFMITADQNTYVAIDTRCSVFMVE